MNPIVIVYIATGVVSILIAVVLVQFARTSTRAAMIERSRLAAEAERAEMGDDALRALLADEMSALADSDQKMSEAIAHITDVLGKEIDKRVTLTRQELTAKYENEIKEKSQNEELAWRKYKKVLGEKKETDAVIRSIAEGLVVVDKSGKVIMMNPAAERLLGVQSKEKLGKPITEGVKDEELLSLVKSAPGEEGGEIELMSKQDETKRVLRASTAVVENESGQTVGMVSVLSDITKQKELDRLKSNFVANITHELRTPLVSIDKSIQLVLAKTAGPLSGDQEQFLTLALRNIKRLSSLINNLLDLSKLEAGKMELKREQVPVERVIVESIESLQTWAQTKAISISKSIEEGVPPVNVDPGKIVQVLVNLLGNAIKYTPNQGAIEVGASSRGDRTIEISVRDNGLGIEKELLPRIFEKFYQVGERAPTDISGTGIGLAIAREIVELHGGKIWAESEKGVGTKFTFTIPM